MKTTGESIAIIGGAGKMGQWLSGFLLEDGFRITIADATYVVAYIYRGGPSPCGSF